jgi:hypothetical protein
MMVLDITSRGILQSLFSLISQLVHGSVQSRLMDVSLRFLNSMVPKAMTL